LGTPEKQDAVLHKYGQGYGADHDDIGMQSLGKHWEEVALAQQIPGEAHYCAREEKGERIRQCPVRKRGEHDIAAHGEQVALREIKQPRRVPDQGYAERRQGVDQTHVQALDENLQDGLESHDYLSTG